MEKDRRLGNLSTPIRVQKLQMALHAKAKAEVGYRFYALYSFIALIFSWLILFLFERTRNSLTKELTI